MIRLLELVDGDVRLAEHDGLKPPPYAILSHRWGDEEVTYDEVQELSCRNKKGYQKVKWCGTRAKEDGYDYFWVDTCCINKTNNTEYAEAINSMFRWYKAAEICYAYLPDVNGPHGKEFEDSEWFERGWTLQELVASRTVRFYDSQSRYLGDKESLGYRLAHITKVHQDVLRDSTKIFDYSIAERMSWMAKRITTRIEDMAYSMLGIFGIDDMPMMYGQGETAFRRLQERIMERSNDFSIFAWRGMKENEYGPGLLATHPKAFEESGNIMPTRVDADYKLAKQMIEVGMRLRPSGPCTYIGLLPCISKFDGSYFGILLRHFPGSKRYARVADSDDQKIWIDPAQVKEFLPADRILVYQDIDKSGGTIDGINYKQVPDMSFHMSPRIRESSDNAQWASRKTLTRPSNAAPDQGILGDFEMDENEADIKAVRVGFDRYSNPVVMIARSSGMKKSGPGKKILHVLSGFAILPPLFLIAGAFLAITRKPIRPAIHKGKGIKNYSADEGTNDFWDYDASNAQTSSSSPILDRNDREGLWLLRGDRRFMEALQVRLLPNIEMPNPMRAYGSGVMAYGSGGMGVSVVVTIRRDATNPYSWNLDIGTEPFPRKQFYELRNQKRGGNSRADSNANIGMDVTVGKFARH